MDILRRNLKECLQDFIDYLSQGDKTIPNAFLLIGNPDAKTFFHFANQWKNKKMYTPILLAGGKGRGTIPLIKNISKYLNESLKIFQYDEMIRNWLQDQKILETDILEFILKYHQIPSSYIFKECKPSCNTKENFINTKDIITELFHGMTSPSVAIVTSPPLLLRSALITKTTWDNNWDIFRWKSYEIKVDSYQDNDLIALCGYLAGYPEEFVKLYPELNSGNELMGYQFYGGDVSKEAWEKLDKIKKAFREFLIELKPFYNEKARNLLIE